MTVETATNTAPVQAPEQSYWFLNHRLLSLLAASEEGSGHFGLVEYRGRQGEEPLPHRHDEAEYYHVLDGALTFTIGGKVFRGVPGTWVVIPSGVEHGFSIDTAEATALVVLAAPGFEEYLREVGARLDTTPASETERYEREFSLMAS